MPRPPTHIPLNEDCPRLAYGTLNRARLNPSKVVFWAWNTPTATLAIRVTGGRDGTLTIASEGSEVRVIRRGRYLACPACGAPCRYLLFREGWDADCAAGSTIASGMCTGLSPS